MALVTTPAVVLRTYPYSETSKIVRLATRDLGVQSAIAKGVLRPKSRFAAGLELLSEGGAQLYHRETRELQTPAAFDPLGVRRELAQGRGGFAPALGSCVRDGTPVPPVPGGGQVAFSTAEGGVLCERCAPPPPSQTTRLPAQAHRDLVALNDPHAPLPALAPAHAAAHRRLVARFVRHHFGETSNLPALDFWERHAWSSPLPSAISAPAPPPAPPPAPAPSAAS